MTIQENLLVVDDINGKDILSIWNGPRFKALRKQHLDDKLSNTLCKLYKIPKNYC